MLNLIAVQAALPVAQRLEERSLQLLALDNTPLQNLMVSMGLPSTVPSEQGMVGLVQGASDTDIHRMAKDDVITLASESVRRLHTLTQGTVLPRIKELIEQVEGIIEPRRIEAILPYTVVMKEIPAVYSNPALDDIVKRFPVPGDAVYATRILAKVDLDRVKALCKTGMAGFDEELDVVLSRSNNEGYAQVNSVLQGSLTPAQLHVDYLPGLIVLANAIYDEPEPGVEMSLTEYNDRVNQLIALTAQLIRGARLRYQQAEKAGTLYTNDGRSSLSTIVVYGRPYRELLEKGLTPEALIGNEMASRRFDSAGMIANRESLERIYHREMNLRNLKVQASMAGITRDAINEVIGKAIKAGGHDLDVGERMVACLRGLVKKVDERNCRNLQQLMTEIVCEVFYPGTDTLTFINLINECGRQCDDNTDIREVTLLATIKYITRWTLRQMTLAPA